MLRHRPLVQHLIDSELANLRQAVDVVEAAIAQELSLIRDRADSLSDEVGGEPDAAYLASLADEYQQLSGEFATILRSALVTRTYAAFEYYLIALCSAYAHDKEIPLEIAEAKRYDVDDARKCLKGRVGIRFPDQSREWQELKRFVQIRNIFAHRGGRLRREEMGGDLGNYIAQHSHLRIWGELRIEIDKPYVPEVIQCLQDVFGQL